MVFAAGIATHAGASAPIRCNGAVATVVGTTGLSAARDGRRRRDRRAGWSGCGVRLDGDDVLCGGGGGGVLLGNRGVDLLLGDGGRDVAIGGRGDDNFRAEVARCEDDGDRSSAIDLQLQLHGDRFESPSIVNQYVYTISNRGALRTGNVVVTDTLPTGFSYLGVSSPNDFRVARWSCRLRLLAGRPCPAATRRTIWSTGTGSRSP
jgi:uncharacterized repeat protein (TIGR01451 family)